MTLRRRLAFLAAGTLAPAPGAKPFARLLDAAEPMPGNGSRACLELERS